MAQVDKLNDSSAHNSWVVIDIVNLNRVLTCEYSTNPWHSGGCQVLGWRLHQGTELEDTSRSTGHHINLPSVYRLFRVFQTHSHPLKDMLPEYHLTSRDLGEPGAREGRPGLRSDDGALPGCAVLHVDELSLT